MSRLVGKHRIPGYTGSKTQIGPPPISTRCWWVRDRASLHVLRHWAFSGTAARCFQMKSTHFSSSCFEKWQVIQWCQVSQKITPISYVEKATATAKTEQTPEIVVARTRILHKQLTLGKFQNIMAVATSSLKQNLLAADPQGTVAAVSHSLIAMDKATYEQNIGASGWEMLGI